MALAVLRMLFAALTLSAITTELFAAIGRSVSLVNFFSFFTIQTNIIVLVVLAASARSMFLGKTSVGLDMTRGAATMYIVTVGVVFALLLSGVDMPTAVPWTNTVLHYVMPVAVAIDWLIDPPKTRITFRRAVIWLAFPALWIAYTLIRGALVGWYPYPFLTPRVVGGYGGIAMYCAAIFAVMLLFIGVLTRAASKRMAAALAILVAGLIAPLAASPLGPAAAAQLSPASQIGPTGVGPIVFGMTPAQARMTGAQFVATKPSRGRKD